MSTNSTRGGQKTIKKNQATARETKQEVGEEVRSSDVQPLVKQPNRDQARGDWDRTGDHQDAGTSRSPAEKDEGFDERS